MNPETTLKLSSSLPKDFAKRQAILLANYERSRLEREAKRLRRQRIRAALESALAPILLAALTLTVFAALFNHTPWGFIEALLAP